MCTSILSIASRLSEKSSLYVLVTILVKEGTAYLGFVNEICFAELGARVICVDMESEMIESLKQRNVPIYKVGLGDMILRNYEEEHFSPTTDLSLNLDEINNKCAVIWGLSFIPKIDDMREVSSLVLIDSLLKEGCERIGYNLVVEDECKRSIGDSMEFIENMNEAVIEVGAVFHVTERKEFCKPSWKIMKKDLVLIDGRNTYDNIESLDY